MARETLFILEQHAKKCDKRILNLIEEFDDRITTIEKEKELPFIIYSDGKSQSYYIECHINANVALPLIDFEPALDIDEQVDYKANRDLRPLHKAFIQMQNDARLGRQFSDLILEYNTEYKREKPLKLLGGQHRAKSIELASSKKINRPHGFKVYFGLTVEQRAELAEVSNTNIQISLDLIDRMAETKLGPNLRIFCQKIGLLEERQDFADRKNPEGIITVRLARTFVVNFFKGLSYRNGANINDKVFEPYLCKSGGIDPEYQKLINDKELWDNGALIDAGKKFAELHKKQIQAIERDPYLRKFAEYRNKATTAAVVSSWSFVEGLLQKHPDRLKKYYYLVKESRIDPLNAKAMSQARHEKSDLETYRGLGARSDKKDRGRMAQLFLLYSDPGYKTKTLDENIIDIAIEKYEANKANERYERKLEKIK